MVCLKFWRKFNLNQVRLSSNRLVTYDGSMIILFHDSLNNYEFHLNRFLGSQKGKNVVLSSTKAFILILLILLKKKLIT